MASCRDAALCGLSAKLQGDKSLLIGMAPIGVNSMFSIYTRLGITVLFGLAVVIAVLGSPLVHAEDRMKPFILASTSIGTVADHVEVVKTTLTDAGFEIVGEYAPYPNAHIVVFTNSDFSRAAINHSRAGYIAGQRVSITKVGDEVTRAGDQIQIAYTNPRYMAAAYRIDTDLNGVAAKLEAALGAEVEFGPEKGLTAEKLRKYHYTFGMEYFDEPNQLASHDSYEEAIAIVEKNLSEQIAGVSKVYRIDITGAKQTVFGVSMKATGEVKNKYMDETYIMGEIDFKPLRSTAHLPYEILVNGGDVEALHARFRIAMNFPDLSMMGSNSFMNIMPSPDAIEEALTLVAGGEVEE